MKLANVFFPWALSRSILLPGRPTRGERPGRWQGGRAAGLGSSCGTERWRTHRTWSWTASGSSGLCTGSFLSQATCKREREKGSAGILVSLQTNIDLIRMIRIWRNKVAVPYSFCAPPGSAYLDPHPDSKAKNFTCWRKKIIISSMVWKNIFYKMLNKTGAVVSMSTYFYNYLFSQFKGNMNKIPYVSRSSSLKKIRSWQQHETICSLFFFYHLLTYFTLNSRLRWSWVGSHSSSPGT